MSEEKTIRINKVLRELNISLDRAVEHLKEKGHEIEARPTTKISTVEYQVLLDEFQTDMSKKVASIEVGEEKRKEKEALLQQIEKEQEEKKAIKEKEPTVIRGKATLSGPKTVGKIDLNPKAEVAAEPEKVEEKEKAPFVEEVKEPAKEEQHVEVKKVAAAEVPKKEEVQEEKPAAEADNGQIKTQYQTLSG
ncbi:MAG: translation initiation factor IF-2, partial [Flavobacteriaceae bacterium]